MISQLALKEQLRWSAEHDYEVPPGQDAWELTLAMMAQLGSTDAELRDNLIYTTIAHWSDGVLGTEHLRQLRLITLDAKHLFCGIGDQDADTVFMRSFSLLVLAVVLDQHRTRPFLSSNEIAETLSLIITYLQQEKDLRGFTGAYGWAHTIAHSADVLDELAECTEMTADNLQSILQAITALISTANVVFTDEEDERLAVAVLSVVRQGVLPEATIATWLHELVTINTANTHKDRAQRINSKHLLRSLYFQSVYKNQARALHPALLEALQFVSIFK